MEPAKADGTSKNTKTVEVDSTVPVSGQADSGYSVSITNLRGKVVLNWINPNPFILAQQAVWLYKGAPPSNPFPGSPGEVTGLWVNGQSGSFETDQLWGPGWSAGLAAQVWGGAFQYLATTPVTA